MSEVKTIKGIDDQTWTDFKGLAVRNRMKAATMFKVLLQDYEKKSTGFWDEIFAHKSVLTKKEQEEFEQRLKSIRKEYGWRI